MSQKIQSKSSVETDKFTLVTSFQKTTNSFKNFRSRKNNKLACLKSVKNVISFDLLDQIGSDRGAHVSKKTLETRFRNLCLVSTFFYWINILCFPKSIFFNFDKLWSQNTTYTDSLFPSHVGRIPFYTKEISVPNMVGFLNRY